MKLGIDAIRQRSLAYAQGDMMRREVTRQLHFLDERWLKAYEEAWFVCGFQGRCRFELDGVVVTVIDPSFRD